MDSLRFSIFLINGIISFISLWLCVPKSFVIIPILSSYHKAINLLWLFSVRLGLFVSLLVYKRIKSLSASKTRIVIVSLFVYEFKLKIYDDSVTLPGDSYRRTSPYYFFLFLPFLSLSIFLLLLNENKTLLQSVCLPSPVKPRYIFHSFFDSFFPTQESRVH